MNRPAQHTISGVARQNEVKGQRSARFSTKSLRPALQSSSPGVSAGSQPRTVLDSGEGGASARRETAKTGRVAERGVGGGTRW